MKKSIRHLFSQVCIPLIPVFTGFTCKSPEHKPNILLIMSDDMGYSDIGCYGSEINTPNLDKLAQTGLRFTQFYNSARCCPTRASLLTGVYPHQAGVGLMTEDKGFPGYKGELGDNVQTIAEVLKSCGYKTYMTGKWHLTGNIGPEGPVNNWPLQRGFDRFYGTIQGAGSYYDPVTLCRNNTFITPQNDPEYQPDKYYYTTAIGDNCVKFIREHFSSHSGSPFFMYVAFTAAHWPLHALSEDIEKYRGVYDRGYNDIREKRFRKMKSLGLIDENWILSPAEGNWEDEEDKAWEIRNMQTYAAMIDCMDQNIGKIVGELKKQGCFENTVIMFLQDNGGCAENYGRGRSETPYPDNLPAMGKNELQTRSMPPMQTRDGRPVKKGRDAMAGPDDSYCGYGKGWANVSNTPFREYKHFVHEGGIASPLVLSWPDGIDAGLNGSLVWTPAHIIDVMATCVDISGADYPESMNGKTILPLEGMSLKPLLTGKGFESDRELFFEHHLNSAIRSGNWKLVRKGNPRQKEVFRWELYDLSGDRTEMKNLADEKPEIVEKLKSEWYKWAERSLVIPGPYYN